jgi:hypothetical protein
MERQTLSTLPRLRETKRTVEGREKHYACQILERQPDSVVVLFVAPVAMTVHGVDLPRGTVTFGHFWAERPYNVYHWLDGRGETLGCYFNLSDQTVLDVETLSWRDLVLDVLVRPGASPEILDELELEELGVPLALRATIDLALSRLLDELPKVMPALEASRSRLWESHQAAILAAIAAIAS